jgi:hypothetical protein
MVLAALVLCSPQLANAEGKAGVPLSVALEYEAPAACPSAAEFRTIVSKRLGRVPFVERSPHRVLVRISQAGDALSGDLLWSNGSGDSTGQQSFPSTTRHCAQLIAAMGFALAVQIHLLETEEMDEGEKRVNQDGLTGAAPTPGAPTPEVPGPATSSAQEEPSLSARDPRPRQAATFFAGAGGGVFIGMSAKVVPAGRLFGGLRWSAAAVELGLEASAPSVVRRADGAGFSQWYLMSTAAGCALVEGWSACALLKVGAVRVSGRDIDVPKESGATLAQSGLRLGLSQRLKSRAFLSLRAEGLVNLTNWSVELDQTPVWSSPRMAFASGLDFMVLFQ